MRRILTLVGLGCGGLVVLLILLGILGALIGGNEETTSKSDEEKNEAEPQDKPGDKKGEEESKKEEDPSVGIGETLEIGDVAWTVTNARRANELASTFGQEPKRGDFVVVDFNFTINGSQAVTLDRVSVALLDSQSRESEPDPDTFGYIDPNKDIFLENVNPGVTRQGEVIFTVPQDAQGFRFRAGDAELFSNEQGYVELGF